MQSIKEIGDRAQDLGKLKEHPSWARLRAEFEKRKEVDLKRLVGRFVGYPTEQNKLCQRELDFVAGFWAGAEWILDNPDASEKALAAALRRGA